MSTFVKNPLAFLAALSTLVAFGPTIGLASDRTVAQTRAVQRAQSTEVVGRARQAFVRFATACFARDQSGIQRAVTDDVVVEYALPDRGMTLAVDTGALDSLCAATALAGPVDQISNLHIYPTNDPNTMFVQYDTASPPYSSAHPGSKEHLTEITLYGDRISRIRDFETGSSEVANIFEGSAHNSIPSHR